MLKFTQTSPTGGDCTASYDVTLDMSYTVREFIDMILCEYSGEWGYIGIKAAGAVFGSPRCEYKQGNLISEMDESVLDKEIESVTSSGGWSRMDYYLTLK